MHNVKDREREAREERETSEQDERARSKTRECTRPGR